MQTATAEKVSLDMSLIHAEVAAMGNLPVPTTAVVMKQAKQSFIPSTNVRPDDITKAMAEVDLTATNTITRFGSKAAAGATDISRQMLDGVRSKDTGPVGDTMNNMMLTIRGLDPKSLKGGGLFGWMKSQASRLVAFGQQFEEANAQIEAMADDLKRRQVELMTSVAVMDRLYDATVIQFHELEIYIIAGERILEGLNSKNIPALQKEVDAGVDGSDGTPASLMPQKLNDLIGKRDQLERKVYDLKLVRMVTLQALPKIRMTQDTDNNLIAKVDTIVDSTISIWYQTIAMGMETAKTQRAADAVAMVADGTEQMILDGAKAHKTAILSAKKSIERSVVGIDAVRQANQLLIETLQEGVAITKAGKKARADGEMAIMGAETALREAVKETAASQASYRDYSDGE